MYNRDLVKNLQQKIVNLAKVYNIIGFGKMDNVPCKKSSMEPV